MSAEVVTSKPVSLKYIRKSRSWHLIAHTVRAAIIPGTDIHHLLQTVLAEGPQQPIDVFRAGVHRIVTGCPEKLDPLHGPGVILVQESERPEIGGQQLNSHVIGVADSVIRMLGGHCPETGCYFGIIGHLSGFQRPGGHMQNQKRGSNKQKKTRMQLR